MLRLETWTVCSWRGDKFGGRSLIIRTWTVWDLCRGIFGRVRETTEAPALHNAEVSSSVFRCAKLTRNSLVPCFLCVRIVVHCCSLLNIFHGEIREPLSETVWQINRTNASPRRHLSHSSVLQLRLQQLPDNGYPRLTVDTSAPGRHGRKKGGRRER